MSKSPSQGTLVSAKLGFVPHTSVTSDAAIRKHLVSPRSPDQSCSGHQQCFGQGPTHQICFCFTLLFFPAEITLMNFFFYPTQIFQGFLIGILESCSGTGSWVWGSSHRSSSSARGVYFCPVQSQVGGKRPIPIPNEHSTLSWECVSTAKHILA